MTLTHKCNLYILKYSTCIPKPKFLGGGFQKLKPEQDRQTQTIATEHITTLCSLVVATIITTLLKVIWKKGRVGALSHTYAVKSPLVTMACPKFTPKSTPSRGPIPKPHYLPHPWTRLTYDAKWHLDPICHFSTMHWTDRHTYQQIVCGKVWSLQAAAL